MFSSLIGLLTGGGGGGIAALAAIVLAVVGIISKLLFDAKRAGRVAEQIKGATIRDQNLETIKRAADARDHANDGDVSVDPNNRDNRRS